MNNINQQGNLRGAASPTCPGPLLWQLVCQSPVSQVLTHSYQTVSFLRKCESLSVALCPSASQRLDAASPRDLFTPAKISKPHEGMQVYLIHAFPVKPNYHLVMTAMLSCHFFD